MYKEHQVIYFFITLITAGIPCLFHSYISQDNVTNYITFLSITFGFTLTSISILFSNKEYLAYLYNTPDIDKSKNLLSRLRLYYYAAINSQIFTLGIALAYSQFFFAEGLISLILSSLIIGNTIASCFVIIFLIKLILNQLLKFTATT